MAKWPFDAKSTPIADIARLAATDPAAAADLARRAQADGEVDPTLYHVLGLHLKAQGRFEEAVAELGKGLELDPKHAGLMTTVGFCLLELGRRQEAAQVFGVAVKLDPVSAEASFGYGWAAERLGALDQAKSAFERAVALDPVHADALAGLSGLAARRRDWVNTRAFAEQAATLDPGQTDALMNLARADLGERRFDAAEVRLSDVINLTKLHPLARANARILLGDALDGAERYEDALDAYAAGKAELAELYAGEFARPGAPTATDAVRAILAEFLETAAEGWAAPVRAPAKGPERGHAFLLGFPRSGTTLLEQVIATHPDMAALGERPILVDAEAQFLSGPGGVTRLAETVSDLLTPFREAYWRRLGEFGVDPVGKVFVDKHPLGTFRLPLIAKVFPTAKIIFAMRDPRDVVLSCFRRSFAMNATMYEFNSIERAAGFYDAVMSAGEVYLERLPLSVHRLRYEDLVADFETHTRALCDFLGVGWTESLQDFAQTNRVIATPSSTQVGRGLYEEGVGQWRNYASALEPAAALLAPWIEKFGYAPG